MINTRKQWPRIETLDAPTPNGVHVLRVSLLHDHPEALREVLNRDEKARADRFHFEADRRRFTVARAGLRQILGSCLRRDPAEIGFAYAANGKPALADPTSALRFNLSHAGELALYAVADSREVGIDIERFDPRRDVDGIADRFFSPDEADALRRLPADARAHAFTWVWTRKEAFLKARGEGLFAALEAFDVTVDLQAPPRIEATRPDAGLAARWSLLNLHPHPEYAATLAAEGSGGDVRCYEWGALDALTRGA